MILEGRGVSPGKAEGEIVKVKEPVSFLGDVDPNTGMVFDEKDIKDSIFVFPSGRGSTVGSYVIYQLKSNGLAPKAIINRQSETIVAAGAIISDMPLVDNVEIDLLKEGDTVRLDGDAGEVELLGIEMTPVVTAFIKKEGKILAVKRSEEVGSFVNRWSAVSGHLDIDDPLKQARTEIEEETGLEVELIRSGDPVLGRGEEKIWKVHPFLFKTEDEPELDWENVEYRWVDPEDLKRLDTVPKLYEAYESVRG